MKTKTVGLFILVAMGILFCAGPVDAAEADFTVLLIGDCAGEHSPELPALLQQSLKAEGFNAQVSVAGKPGATSAEALDALEKSVLRQPPDLVVAQFGLHEAPGAAKPNRDNARPNPLQFRSNLDKLVRQLRGAGIDVILMTPNPVFWTDAARKIWSPPPFQPQEAWGRNVFLEEHAKTLRWVGLKHSLPIVDVYQRCVNHEALNGPPPPTGLRRACARTRPPRQKLRTGCATRFCWIICLREHAGKCRAGTPSPWWTWRSRHSVR